MPSGNMILFGTHTPGVYRLEDIFIYDPLHPEIDPVQSGKEIPAKDSLVIDESAGPGNFKVYVVMHVDDEGEAPTFASELQLLFDQASQQRMVNYGQNYATLYYEADYYTALDGITHYARLIVDHKLLFYSELATKYTLEDNDGNVFSFPSSLIEAPVPGAITMQDGDGYAKWFVDCACAPIYTFSAGDIVTLKVYNSEDTQIAQVDLVVAEAPTYTDVLTTDVAVVASEVTLTANPTFTWDGDEIQVPVGSTPTDLEALLAMTITYGDDSTEAIAVDGEECFVYGLDDVIATEDYIGTSFDILVKLFLPHGLHSPMSSYADQGSERHIVLTQTLRIIAA